ncbi:uncharacterized protein sha isoform X2 [Linepithema humile]|uniref:uncharacterized protein sha isoform X2 n=1 Tax=Linepithema humile TaxID=83485 RepID=UPI00351F7F90
MIYVHLSLQNAVGKMRFLALVLASCFYLLQVVVHCQELSVIRHSDGDIFTIEGSCTEACTVLSSGTASPYSRSSSSSSLLVPNSSCTCQCNFDSPIFREDLHICVNDIHECNVAGFVSNNGYVERVPYVFLPQRGQIIYPHAEIRFEGVTTPVCGIAGAQQLGRAGWSELRNLSDTEPPFRLFRDEGRTFLQWIGETGLRDAAEGRVVTAKLVCRDASPKSTSPGVFTPCVAFRVAGSPSKNNVREVMFASTSQVSQGLSATEYIAIGLSSVILALIYIASVSLYLHSRRAKRKSIEEANITLDGGRDGSGLVKNNPLLTATRHFESDTNSGLTESDLGDDLAPSDNEQGFENITSAIVHPHCVYLEQSEGLFSAGSILGERLPEEDVRVVETADNAHQQDVPVLPGAQRRKLYFNPAYFDRQLLLAPPPAAIEFLLKIREVISIAKHKMAAKRFVPILTGIPEEGSGSERCESAKSSKQQRITPSSVPGSAAKSRKSQRCTGCPGCSESPRHLPALPVPDLPSHGESKVRAWLEDVRPPQRRWRDRAEDTRRNFQENARTFARNLEYLKELARRDLADPEERARLAGKSVSSWKDNPPMLRTFQNIAARSEILENDDRHSVSRRSTRSMFEGSEYDRYNRGKRRNDTMFRFTAGDDAINAKVRKAIENSFIKQMEENAAVENGTKRNMKDDRSNKSEDESAKTDRSSSNTEKSEKSQQPQQNNSVPKKSRKPKAPSAPPSKKKELPDMINELPGARNTAKRIMDAVIREMVDVKALDHHHVKSTDRATIGDYEVDSLERAKCSRKSSTSPDQSSTDNQSSPALSTALPMDEELTMQNAVINTRTGEMTMSKLGNQIIAERNRYNNLPELLSNQRAEYSLVSEVYVNDGYASPACSDDSGPEIQYEPENPGHLTIKVQDSPENYIKLDESEYEPDTLDRKPMKLRINDDVHYDREEIANEVYVDSLERPAQILLKSKGSFRNENSALQRDHGSLREIYEAKIKSISKDALLTNGHDVKCQTNGDSDGTVSWKKCRYLTPDSRQAKRQRKPHNQPDVVPLPPTEEIYQRPKLPRRVEDAKLLPPPSSPSKNAWDRSPVEAGDPTASNGTPVLKTDGYHVGNCLCAPQTRSGVATDEMHREDVALTEIMFLDERIDDRTVTNGCRDCPCETRIEIDDSADGYKFHGDVGAKEEVSSRGTKATREKRAAVSSSHHRSSAKNFRTRSGWNVDNHREDESRLINNDRAPNCSKTRQMMKGLSRSCDASNLDNAMLPLVADNRRGHVKVEDSGYLSSTDSNGSHKRLLRHDVSSVSEETDETESVCDGASESGAESIGTDSVFFGNFRRLSEMSKSADSGVDLDPKNPPCYQPLFGARHDVAVVLERTNFSASDSETESLVTVLPPCSSQCNSLVS